MVILSHSFPPTKVPKMNEWIKWRRRYESWMWERTSLEKCLTMQCSIDYIAVGTVGRVLHQRPGVQIPPSENVSWNLWLRGKNENEGKLTEEGATKEEFMVDLCSKPVSHRFKSKQMKNSGSSVVVIIRNVTFILHADKNIFLNEWVELKIIYCCSEL